MLVHASHHELPLNLLGRDFIVGDVHGHAALLDCLLACVAFDASRDRLIALGDLIDRGPHSEQLLDRVERLPWLYSLRGNHEAMLRDSLRSVMSALLWHRNGGGWGQELEPADLHRLARRVDGLPLAMTLPLADGRRIGLIHAEVPIGASWRIVESPTEPQDPDEDTAPWVQSALWGRTRISAFEALQRLPTPPSRARQRWASIRRALAPVADIDLIVSGHSYAYDRRPMACANLLFIDTGVFEGDGRLTLFEPLSSRCWQARYDRDGHPRVHLADGEPVPPAWSLPDDFD